MRKHFFYSSKKLIFHFGIIFFFCSCEMNNHSNQKLKKTTSPNFILILADDQGWNGTSVKMMHDEPGSKSDYFETPNLVKFANKGMRFSDAYASAPVCAPSRYSIQFGKTPARL